MKSLTVAIFLFKFHFGSSSGVALTFLPGSRFTSTADGHQGAGAALPDCWYTFCCPTESGKCFTMNLQWWFEEVGPRWKSLNFEWPKHPLPRQTTSKGKNSSMELSVIWGNFSCSDLACSDLACSDLAHSDLACFLGDLRWVARFGLKWAKLVQAKSKHL